MDTNITVADLSSGCRKAAALPSLVQWDRGQILQITGVDLPTAYNVEFAVQGVETTVTMIGNAGGVEVPNALLETGKTITAYVVLHEGENDRETEYWITINVKPRPQPSDVEPDPGQEALIDQLIAHLDNAVDAAEDSAESAENSATAADQSAENAEAWAVGERNGTPVSQDDGTYENNAKFYAEKAEQAAGDLGWIYLYIDDDGHLIYVRTSNVLLDFKLEDGHLFVGV